MAISDITITSLDQITAFGITTGDYMFTLDELQSASINQSEEKQDITGKQGRKISSIKKNKACTVSATNGLISHGLLAAQTGGDFVNNTTGTEVMWNETLTVTSNAATTTYKAVGTAGAEIVELYIKNADGTLGTSLTQDSAVAAGKFTYAPTTKALAFYAGTSSPSTVAADCPDGTEIVVFYKRKIVADSLSSFSDTYSKKAQIYVDCTGEDICGNIYHIQYYFPKADISGNFEISMGDNQAVHAFEAEALAGACGSSGEFFTYTIFGTNTADYTAG